MIYRVDPLDTGWYDHATTPHVRAHYVHKMRMATTSRVSAQWAVRELLYHATAQNEHLADAVLVVTLRWGFAGSAVAATPLPGRRVLRLLYLWSDLEPYLGLPPARMSHEVLAPMATEGGVLRARIRQERASP